MGGGAGSQGSTRVKQAGEVSRLHQVNGDSDLALCVFWRAKHGKDSTHLPAAWEDNSTEKAFPAVCTLKLYTTASPCISLKPPKSLHPCQSPR